MINIDATLERFIQFYFTFWKYLDKLYKKIYFQKLMITEIDVLSFFI